MKRIALMTLAFSLILTACGHTKKDGHCSDKKACCKESKSCDKDAKKNCQESCEKKKSEEKK